MIDLQINGQTISLNVSPEILKGLTEQQIEWCALNAEKYIFSEWVQKAGLILDGQPFSFDRHEYLQEPYEMLRDSHEMIFEKAAQMGLSTLTLLNAFHGAKHGAYPHGVLYLLPSKTDVTEFSKSKAQGIIDQNPVIGSWITETDAANIKKIGDAWLYFRGMQSRIGLKTISIDLTIFDEIEEVSDWSLVALAEERMSHVEIPRIHRLSVPSIPEYGIDSYFSGNADVGIEPSDQRYWFVKCSHCNTETCLEDEFPDCIVEVSARDQKAIRVCKKCRQEVNPSNGRWIARKPDARVMGYHFSQLFSHFVNPWKILDQFNKKRELTTLFNDKLGIPYVEAEARLEVQEVLSLCGSSPQLAAFEGPAAMGIDQPKEEGGKFHVVISYKQEGQACNVIRVCIRNTWNELSDLMRTFNVTRCVVDALPDQAKARDFAQAHRNQVFLCFYSEHQKGASKWNEDDFTVMVDRTEIHNNLSRLVHERSVSLPRKDDDIILFAKHLHAMARKREEDKDTGSVRHVYVRVGDDHYRHAACYALIALNEIGEFIPPKKEKDWMHKRRSAASSWRTV